MSNTLQVIPEAKLPLMDAMPPASIPPGTSLQESAEHLQEIRLAGKPQTVNFEQRLSQYELASQVTPSQGSQSALQ
jgi:hypothetical protein